MNIKIIDLKEWNLLMGEKLVLDDLDSLVKFKESDYLYYKILYVDKIRYGLLKK